ncbi:pyridine nucleotide-disulfide oxidoreductase [Flavobacterium magnum]|uniref:Pyridine nucleotide-disulfide oxidoreductase n=1 Tax=Flavobacterium magnum TaxID=2162713 RepID=A0A2S0RAL6_9FLAO|nr:FAD-dependent oxidoreductase [Flavobacterium magnum]AWA29077.1 pyridine nucleotide-disulfide oxidoreductase [Flavobacterium magnum]
MFDVLIFGGGVSGVSCALVLGSAVNKPYASNRKIGIFTHQKTSNLQEALFNNAYGIAPGTTGADLLSQSTAQLADRYPHVVQLANEKVIKVAGASPEFTVTTNKGVYKAGCIVVAIGWTNTFAIDGLMEYVVPHKKAIPEKNRIQLRNTDHKVAEGIYVAGTLAGWRSQLAIAAGSGAAVATDILTVWNDGNQSQSHDSIRK